MAAGSVGAETGKAYAYLMSGDRAAAVAAAKKAVGDPREQRVQVTADLAAILAYSGRAEEARPLLASLRDGRWEELRPAGAVAWVHVALGEYDAAAEWYRRARAEGSIYAVSELLVDPLLEQFRKSPQGVEVLALFDFPAHT
jgi:hypothetical protein